jgi:TM2 domain-containing membrane protein YozV
MSNTSTTGQGSAGNVIAAICSFFIPGLGQLVQGRILAALLMFVLAGVVWFVSFGTLGWIMHLVACIEAARWRKRG